MNARAIARILGLLFLIFGVAGFIPFSALAPAAPLDAPTVLLDGANRVLFGIFPVNVFDDVLHVLLGLAGVLCAASFAAGVWYCRVVSVLSLLLAICGVVPVLSTLLGVAPVYGYDAVLDGVVALAAAYGGFARGSVAPQVHAASGS
jgi:hypothetical protein